MSSLLTPRDVRDLAERLAVRPTKTLGQNFVHDAGTVRKIVRTAGVEPGHHVLEVGPGLGSLTLALLEAGAYVTAVEIDPVLSAALPRTVSVKMPNARQHLQVVNADALTVTSPEVLPSGPAEVTTPQPTAVVANLPYNVAVPVVLTLLEALPAVETMLVMVQAEVGHRLVAAPGSRTYGIPSAKLAWFASADVVATISRTVFWPVPNVDSVLVRITRRAQPGPTALRDATFSAIDAAFAQRRKMLRAALASWAGSAARAEALLQSAGIDPTKRGETLTIDDYARLGATAIARSQSTASSDH